MSTMTTLSGPAITGASAHGQEDLRPELGISVSDASGTPETVYYLVRTAGSATWNVTNGHTESGVAGDEILYKVEAGKLLPGKTYEWSARACNGSTCSPYTTVTSWTVDPTLGAGERKYFSFKSFTLTDRMTAKVNLGTGNLLVEMNDLSVPGVTSDLPLGQTYNSLAIAPGSHNASGAMGKGWSFSLPPDLGLAIHLDNTVTFWDATGTPVWFFHPTHFYVPTTGTLRAAPMSR
jgi:hypothetical protein